MGEAQHLQGGALHTCARACAHVAMAPKSSINHRLPRGRPPKDTRLATLRQIMIDNARAEIARDLDPARLFEDNDWEERGFIGPRRRVYRDGPKELTPKMVEMIALIVAGVDPGDAAKAVGYFRSAGRRLMHSPMFANALAGARESATCDTESCRYINRLNRNNDVLSQAGEI